jgi:hypothetical protein
MTPGEVVVGSRMGQRVVTQILPRKRLENGRMDVKRVVVRCEARLASTCRQGEPMTAKAFSYNGPYRPTCEPCGRKLVAIERRAAVELPQEREPAVDFTWQPMTDNRRKHRFTPRYIGRIVPPGDAAAVALLRPYVNRNQQEKTQ